jgi:hypothetical protein
MVKEVSEILLQSTQNKPKTMEESSTPFYTPAELGSFGMAPEHKEQLDKWINKELIAIRNWATEEHKRLY